MQLDMAQVYTDFSGLAALRARAREDEEAALDQVSRQFESLFVQMMLKSMRDASLGEGLLDSKQSEFYREMYDKQIAMEMAEGKGVGLAAVIKRQLGGGVGPGYEGLQPSEYLGMPVVAESATVAAPGEGADKQRDGGQTSSNQRFDGDPETFLRELWPAAEQAAAKLGLAPEALLAQAALETGWGRHVMQHRDGVSSHNLFGIKADRRWQGDKVHVSWYTEGYRCIDISDPSNPVEVASYDTWPGSSGGYNGCWGCYPFLPSGNVLVSDRATGLYIVRPSGASFTAFGSGCAGSATAPCPAIS